MSDRKRRTRTPVRLEPFDLERLARGEALAGITTTDGRFLIGRLYTDEMFVVDGPPVEVRATQAAEDARRTGRTLAMLLAGGTRVLGRSEDESIADLIAAGFLDSDRDRETHVRDLKRWRAEYRRTFGSDKPTR